NDIITSNVLGFMVSAGLRHDMWFLDSPNFQQEVSIGFLSPTPTNVNASGFNNGTGLVFNGWFGYEYPMSEQQTLGLRWRWLQGFLISDFHNQIQGQALVFNFGFNF